MYDTPNFENNNSHLAAILAATQISMSINQQGKTQANANVQMTTNQTMKHNHRDVMEITRRLHKIKRRLLLQVAHKQDSGEGRDETGSIYTKTTCNCCEDNDSSHLSETRL